MRRLNFLLILLLAASINLVGCGGGGGGGGAPTQDGNDGGGGEPSDVLPGGDVYNFTDLGNKVANLGLDSWALFVNNNGQIAGETTGGDQLFTYVLEDKADSMALFVEPLGGLTSEAYDFNDNGQVVGQSDTAAGDFQAFFWDVDDGNTVAIGTLGGPESSAEAVNSQGKVAGWSDIDANQNFQQAFVWQNGVLTNIHPDPKGEWDTTSKAFDINAGGKVVGFGKIDGANRAFIWDSASGMRNIDDLMGFGSTAQLINDLGYVAGQFITSSGEVHAFSWQNFNQGMVEIEPLGGGTAMAVVAMNASGQIVGDSRYLSIAEPPNSVLDTHAFFWDPQDGIVDLGTLGGRKSGALAINDKGEVVGWSEASDDFVHAFYWKPGSAKMEDLGRLYSFGGDTKVNDINDDGMIVGEAKTFSDDDIVTSWYGEQK
ncbi:MAG: hypothetical protein C0617_00965 [Desulfuromonas sp.]|uniref:hypothetical protein n=1 Tax=Desulfuromonas sp. TaxID=892 RepID=UPI000CBAEFEA|nr:hypothetical protein [Desulfuromonas sp.]PLX86514.1 MAG: hypothetical protein C0617_00965 [Desulfuromonas sp.]